ncbi:pneumococcal serine-rich repeat protein-like [Dermacentor albipictus]|uniref:pneumococcal serine-rich repeat protein-like n=1 Tax=Dermacentor albipictus TaxID=60249 RepID=UPI0031FD481C
MADDDDDSDEKSSMSSSMSTAGGGKGKAGGGGSGFGLCLCLVGVLGICGALAVAAFLLLDDGGGSNKTANASEASSAAASKASSHAASAASVTAASAPLVEEGTEDAPRLDAYGRFAQEEDKPLKVAAVARQRQHQKSSRRRSRVRWANGAVARQSGRDQGTERASETRAKLAAATRRSTRRFTRDISLATNGVRLHRNRQHPVNAPSAGAAVHRSASLRTDSDKRRSVASSHKVSVASADSQKEATVTKHAVARKNATRRAGTADGNGTTTDRLNEKAATASSDKVAVVLAGSRAKELARTSAPTSEDTTRSASASDANRSTTGSSEVSRAIVRSDEVSSISYGNRADSSASSRVATGEDTPRNAGTPDANRSMKGSPKASHAVVRSDEVSSISAGSRVNVPERTRVVTSEDTTRNTGASDAKRSITGSSNASRALIRSNKVLLITPGGHANSSARTLVATSRHTARNAGTRDANRSITGSSKASRVVARSDEVLAISAASRVKASSKTRIVTSDKVIWNGDKAAANRRTAGTSKLSSAVVKPDEVLVISYDSRPNKPARARENAKLSAGTADTNRSATGGLKEKASHGSFGGTSISAANDNGSAVRTENEFSRGGAPASLSVLHAQ